MPGKGRHEGAFTPSACLCLLSPTLVLAILVLFLLAPTPLPFCGFSGEALAETWEEAAIRLEETERQEKVNAASRDLFYAITQSDAGKAELAIALGADACYVATAALLALGCHLCRTCQTGKCNWGIATQQPDLTKRLNPEIGADRLVNLMTAWKHEIKELLGGMGINSIEALRGNRLMLRGVGLNEKELEILGISHAGE